MTTRAIRSGSKSTILLGALAINPIIQSFRFRLVWRLKVQNLTQEKILHAAKNADTHHNIRVFNPLSVRASVDAKSPYPLRKTATTWNKIKDNKK